MPYCFLKQCVHARLDGVESGNYWGLREKGKLLEHKLYADFFSPAIGAVFTIKTTVGEIPLILKEIVFKERHNLGPYHCYILIFSGPAEVYFNEGRYLLEQERLGCREIHIAPLTVTETGYDYQAIFSILK